MQLRISVTFHEPIFHGVRGDGKPEWPPSPWRLFCALVNGTASAQRGRDWAAAREAFRWLEKLPAPTIIAPQAEPGAEYMTVGLTNDADVEARAQVRGLQIDTRDTEEGRRVMLPRTPTRMHGGSTVHYLWGIGSEDRELALRVVEEAGQLTTLGLGIDAAYASGSIEPGGGERLPGIRWWSCPGYRGNWRVPTDGSFDELEEIHQRRLVRIREDGIDTQDRPAKLRRILYAPDCSGMPRPYVAFYLRKAEDDADVNGFCSWDPKAATLLAAAVREIVAEAAAEEGLSEQQIREYVTGHVQRGVRERLSYLCLPTTGEPYADGRIRRVMIVEPWGGDGKHVDWIRRRVAGRAIVSSNGNFCGRLVPIVEGQPDAFDGILGIYKKRARVWSSVTPVVLPGTVEYAGAWEKLILRSLEHAGLPYPARWERRNGTDWRGLGPDVRYFLPPYLRGMPTVNLRLGFERPLPGPIALGSGRHCGLGLFAGLDDVPLPI